MTIQTDALIVGAGPCGLFQVFELGLLGLKADVVDSMPLAGGQCIELYPDKPIYDIPAVPVCTGEELIRNLMVQIEPFNAGLHLGQEVTEVVPQEDGSFIVRTSNDTEFHARTVIIAGGVGSFQPRVLRAEGAAELVDTHLFYRVKDPSRFAGKKLAVLGGGDSALDWALELAPAAASLTLIHRTDQFRAAPASVAKLRAMTGTGKVSMIEHATVPKVHAPGGTLEAITLKASDGSLSRLFVDDMLVFYGLAPKLGPIANWGLDLNRKTVNVDTEKFQTNIPGIFAIGDINEYPGKKKLILSGFHEAALAAFAAKEYIEPGKKARMQYTTTSPLMHKRLGLADSAQ